MKRAIMPHDILAFLLEISALMLLARLCLSFVNLGSWRWLLAGAALAGFVTLWALFFAPTASRRLKMPWLLWGKLILLAPPGLAFLRDGQTWPTLGWVALVIIHLVTDAIQKRS